MHALTLSLVSESEITKKEKAARYIAPARPGKNTEKLYLVGLDGSCGGSST